MEANYDTLVTWNTENKLQEKKIICNLKRIGEQLSNSKNNSYIKEIKDELQNLGNILLNTQIEIFKRWCFPTIKDNSLSLKHFCKADYYPQYHEMPKTNTKLKSVSQQYLIQKTCDCGFLFFWGKNPISSSKICKSPKTLHYEYGRGKKNNKKTPPAHLPIFL